MLPVDRLDQIVQRFEFLEAQLNAGPPADEIARISREYAELKPVVAGIAEWRAAKAGLAEAQAMLADPDMRELAEDEISRLRASLPDLEQALRLALAPMTNDFVALLKDSSLVSVITVVELTKQTAIYATNIGSWALPGALCALLYLALSLPLSRAARALERRWSLA